MTKRLQVLLDEEEYREIQAFARRQRTTMSEWVRQTLRKARIDPYGTINARTINAKLRAIADASRYEYPTADIQDMLREVESGHDPHEDTFA